MLYILNACKLFPKFLPLIFHDFDRDWQYKHTQTPSHSAKVHSSSDTESGHQNVQMLTVLERKLETQATQHMTEVWKASEGL